ncbi:MAG: orotate phosphoribosyltransferase [Thermoguttaceae bacterium]|nr:orotate phosphoribosyltransferase [Thermoguttaceae bacterium]
MYDRDALADLIREKALQFGDFTLASGKKSTFYLDCRKVTLDSEGSRLIGEGILELLFQQNGLPAAVGGMAIGADPITASVITMAAVHGKALRGFIVRKEAKDHGTKKFVEGPVQPGETVVILEDVVTTGGSALAAIERVEAFGLKVRGVIGLIDRNEGGREAFAARGITLTTLFTIDDFLQK